MSAQEDAPAAALADGDLRFVEPIPGLGGHRLFRLTFIPDAPGLHSLRAVASQGPAPRLFVADAAVLLPGYDPEIPEVAREMLDGRDAHDLRLLVVLHPADDTGPLTANLFAPIVVNAASRAALQVLLDGTAWPLQLPLEHDGEAPASPVAP